ncbi:MAG: UDP-N-acetylenolpyruvoylglucosamine reductase, partial [Alphaproteobacteria bacterium]
MMTAERLRPLSECLPPARGRLLPNAPLARYSWFRTGGPAEVLFEPADEADL